METILAIAISLFAGLILSRLAKLLKLPAVTAYLVAGILVGPYVLGAIGVEGLGFTSAEKLSELSLVSDVALGFIAFSMGNEFRLDQLKKIGKKAAVIGVLQAVAATLVVDAALIGLHFIIPDVLPLPAAITLGAIASATAPAATLMVVKQYKAKGALTDILLPVVAIDDAVGLVLFAVSFGVARTIADGAVNILAIILEPLLEVIFSLLLGLIMGLAFNLCERFFHSKSKRLAVSLCFIFFTVAISNLPPLPLGQIHVALSPLLACMMLGTVFCNICDFSLELMSRVDSWASPVLILFFVISGAELELDVFRDPFVILVGVIYIIARSIGKYSGAFGSAKLMSCEDNIVKNLGITLLPQAGVALGMAIKAKDAFVGANAEIGIIISNITLFAVLVYEMVGPMLTKMALTAAGDIDHEGKKSARIKDGQHFHRHHDHHVETYNPEKHK